MGFLKTKAALLSGCLALPLHLLSCTGYENGKPGSRAYAINRGLKGDQIDTYVRMYRAGERKDEAATDGNEILKNEIDLSEPAPRGPKKRDSDKLKWDSSGLFDIFDPFTDFTN